MTRSKMNSASVVRSEFLALLPDNQKDNIDDIPLADLGVDSLDFFEKVLFLDEEYGIKISIEELDNDLTLGEVLSSLETDC